MEHMACDYGDVIASVIELWMILMSPCDVYMHFITYLPFRPTKRISLYILVKRKPYIYHFHINT